MFALTFVDAFKQQVARTPGNIALVHDQLQLTYEQLDQAARCLAQLLIAEGGVGP